MQKVHHRVYYVLYRPISCGSAVNNCKYKDPFGDRLYDMRNIMTGFSKPVIEWYVLATRLVNCTINIDMKIKF